MRAYKLLAFLTAARDGQVASQRHRVVKDFAGRVTTPQGNFLSFDVKRVSHKLVTFSPGYSELILNFRILIGPRSPRPGPTRRTRCLASRAGQSVTIGT